MSFFEFKCIIIAFHISPFVLFRVGSIIGGVDKGFDYSELFFCFMFLDMDRGGF